jgi:hypothetical protein
VGKCDEIWAAKSAPISMRINNLKLLLTNIDWTFTGI